jgi:predicted AlkP superfamily pyrophosphatase or phosphodiesterase
MKVLTAFIDGLKPDSLKHMDFLESFSEKRRIKSELGYSNPAHASMYTGVYPNKHHYWFIWQYAPKSSPFKSLGKIKLDILSDNIYYKYSIYKIIRKFHPEITSFYGIPFLYWIPFQNWKYFDISEKKFWTDPDFSRNFPTIFDVLQHYGISYETIGLTRFDAGNSSNIIQNHILGNLKDWTYLFFGDIDPLSHKYGQNSKEVIERSQKIDRIIEKYYKKFENDLNEFCFIVYSDHGHISVKDTINLDDVFKQKNDSLKQYKYFIDSNFARFWLNNENERKSIESVLTTISDKGFILSQTIQEKYHVDMPDNRYGDIIFYLDTPYVFDRSSVSPFGRKIKNRDMSAHGYLPDYPDSDGMFLSNRQIKSSSYFELVDIFPSIIKNFDLPIPDNIDGAIIWR